MLVSLIFYSIELMFDFSEVICFLWDLLATNFEPLRGEFENAIVKKGLGETQSL